MPRTYVAKKPGKKPPTPEDIEKAVALVEEGNSVRSVAKDAGIPHVTLRRWVQKGVPATAGSRGRYVLSASDEEMIVVALNKCGSMGWPIGFDEVVPMVKSYLDSCGRVTVFNENTPGKDWCMSFKKRHAGSFRWKKPEILTTSRGENMSKENLNHFFNMVGKVYEETGLATATDAAERIYNLDETGFNTNPCGKKLFFPKTARDSYMLAPTCGKTTYTVLFAANAAGEYVPPMVVYKGKYLYGSWTEGGPIDCSYSNTMSGWMEDYVFENWFVTCFIPAVSTKAKPVVVFLDGYGAHLTYKTVMAAISENIEIIAIPPATSHALQPLDVSVFGPVKANWRNILNRYYRETRHKLVCKAAFPGLLKQLCEKMKESHVIGGFRGSGLWPLNRDAVRAEKILDGGVDEQQPTTSQSGEEEPATPRKLLRNAIVQAIVPPLSAENEKCVSNQKKRRKRVQAKHGEIMTSAEAVERLRLEEIDRKEKAKKKKDAEKTGPPPSKKKKVPAKMVLELSDPEEEESSDEEQADALCVKCRRRWQTYKGNGVWVCCDVCDEYVCPKCVPKDTDMDDDFYCDICRQE
jgi:hypothetical protein